MNKDRLLKQVVDRGPSETLQLGVGNRTGIAATRGISRVFSYDDHTITIRLQRTTYSIRKIDVSM